MHVEDFLESVCGISVEIGLESTKSLTMKEFVLLDKGLELFLDAC